jgi:hypothetical protein
MPLVYPLAKSSRHGKPARDCRQGRQPNVEIAGRSLNQLTFSKWGLAFSDLTVEPDTGRFQEE